MSSLVVPDAAKLLYLDSDFMLEMECKSTLVNGACPPQHASFFVFARAHVTTQELRTRFVQEIKKRTHGCFEVDLSLAEKNGKYVLLFPSSHVLNSCPSSSDCPLPETCFMDDFSSDDAHRNLLLGDWFLVARQLRHDRVVFHDFDISFRYKTEFEYSYQVNGHLRYLNIFNSSISML